MRFPNNDLQIGNKYIISVFNGGFNWGQRISDHSDVNVFDQDYNLLFSFGNSAGNYPVYPVINYFCFLDTETILCGDDNGIFTITIKYIPEIQFETIRDVNDNDSNPSTSLYYNYKDRYFDSYNIEYAPYNNQSNWQTIKSGNFIQEGGETLSLQTIGLDTGGYLFRLNASAKDPISNYVIRKDAFKGNLVFKNDYNKYYRFPEFHEIYGGYSNMVIYAWYNDTTNIYLLGNRNARTTRNAYDIVVLDTNLKQIKNFEIDNTNNYEFNKFIIRYTGNLYLVNNKEIYVYNQNNFVKKITFDTMITNIDYFYEDDFKNLIIANGRHPYYTLLKYNENDDFDTIIQNGNYITQSKKINEIEKTLYILGDNRITIFDTEMNLLKETMIQNIRDITIDTNTGNIWAINRTNYGNYLDYYHVSGSLLKRYPLLYTTNRGGMPNPEYIKKINNQLFIQENNNWQDGVINSYDLFHTFEKDSRAIINNLSISNNVVVVNDTYISSVKITFDFSDSCYSILPVELKIINESGENCRTFLNERIFSR